MRTFRSMGLVTAVALVPAGAVAVGTPLAVQGAPSCWGRAATIVADSFGDTLMGTPGPDVIYGSDGDDTISGLAGNDRVCGRRGSDRISGGTGHDKLSGGLDAARSNPSGDMWLHGDVIEPGQGYDVVDLGFHRGVHFVNGDPSSGDFVGDVLSYATSRHGVQLDLAAGTATGQGRDSLVGDANPRTIVALGSPHRDVIKGTEVTDWIGAGPGDDTVFGRSGDDHIFERSTGSGSDNHVGGDGADTIDTVDGRDTVKGGAGSDQLFVAQADSGNGAIVEGGRGGDRMQIEGVGRPYAYDGGPGPDMADLVLVGGQGSTTVDMLNGRIEHTGKVSPATGIEEWVVRGEELGPVVFVGTPRADFVYVGIAMSVTAHLGGGADYLDATELTDRSEIWAGPGNDNVLLSGAGELIAYLGPGDDVAADPGNGITATTVHEYYGGLGSDSLSAPNGQPVACDSIESGDCPIP